MFNIDIRDLFRIINLILKENKNLLKLNCPISISYLRTLTRFVLHHNYIIFNDTIFKQCTGLPQGVKRVVFWKFYIFSITKEIIPQLNNFLQLHCLSYETSIALFTTL